MRLSILLAAFLLIPAQAGQVQFSGRTLDVGDGQDNGPIQRMVGAEYNIPGTAADIIGRAQTCAASVDGLSLVGASPDSGTLVLRANVDYRSGFSARTIHSRLDFLASDSVFQITETELEVREGGGDADFTALTQADGSWEKGLDALVGLENKLVDCLYR